MSSQIMNMGEALRDYVRSVTAPEDPLLARLREETAGRDDSAMQIGPEQGAFMALLVELIEARNCIEVGVFTGYSSLAVACALPPGGKLVACDVNEETTAIARRYWKEAGVEDKIELRLGPATESMDALIAEGGAGAFDFVFIDADKVNYQEYFERALELLRPGGLVAVDNVLWGGSVIDVENNTDDTCAIRDFNAKLAKDERVTIALVPIGDGLTLARKRA